MGPRTSKVNEDTTTSDAALAVESIPAYVELSNMFIALVPELTHKDTLELANYSTWLDRGRYVLLATCSFFTLNPN